ncbi:pimeloyl-ACP methyl ester carboxylesterase [Caulobacter ginsengisoli]|uniref:Pimeloyl-ACP methyl ester carboxylesterase n=1 Tax=Caulobacter ginsengisoli TaxID=400775 RepID=A0ABU0IPD2_9CAUL|nr:alpha/beta hydrolase [Caulobacter ginsengisoli]MDQ0463866.1 pimeloyl-ACP methyl ester carboxylesterase [Caulobacter ginsengisoli]
MHRRDILTLTAAGAAAAALPAPSSAKGAAPRSKTPDLFVRDWGEGRPVVFLAGWTLTSDTWGYVMQPLARQGLRTIAYDRRGHGGSADPGRGYDFDTLADDLKAVLERLDLKDVVLVAHSMGGGEAIRYFARHGGTRLSHLVLVAPATPCIMQKADNPMGVPAAALDQNRAVMARDFPAWMDANGGGFFTPDTSEGVKTWVKTQMQRTSLQALVECNRALCEADFRPELSKVSVPTLVLHGDKDASAPLDFTGRRTAAGIKGAKLVVYEGAPHGLFVSHAARLAADIAAFAKT